MSETRPQHEKSVEEEIRELTSYLNGIPASLRSSQAFGAYEARLQLLKQELALTRRQSVEEERSLDGLRNFSRIFLPAFRASLTASLSRVLRVAISGLSEFSKKVIHYQYVWKYSLLHVNEVGKQWGGLLNFISGLVALVAVLGWLKSASQVIVRGKELEEVKAVKVGLAEIVNEEYFRNQQSEYERLKGIPEPFSLGPSAAVQQGATLRIEGTVSYPLDCAQYWILFLGDDDLVWPKVPIPNTGLPYQHVDKFIAVPAQLQRGRILLACVQDQTHEQFKAWLEEGRDAPLLRPTRLDIALESTITTSEGVSP